MTQWLKNVARLARKELFSLLRDPTLMALIAFAFTLAVYSVAKGIKAEVSNASVAIVDAAEFSLEGRTMRNVRQLVNRVARQGYVAEIRREKDYEPEELRALWERAGAWRGTDTERGFSMALGRVSEAGDEECVIATATKDGELHAILHFVPWGTDGLSLDLHRLCAASGVSAEITAPPRFRGATLEQALHGGEDYELLFTTTAAARVPALFEKLLLTRIGIIRKGRPGEVLLDGAPLAPLGYDHFRQQ